MNIHYDVYPWPDPTRQLGRTPDNPLYNPSSPAFITPQPISSSLQYALRPTYDQINDHLFSGLAPARPQWHDSLFTIDDPMSPVADASPAASASVPRSPDPPSAPMSRTAFAIHSRYNNVKADPDESDMSARFILEHPAYPTAPHTAGDPAPFSPTDPASPLNTHGATFGADNGVFSLTNFPGPSSSSSTTGNPFPASAAPDLPPGCLPHSLTAPLRAVNASKEMRALMGVFRLDPFASLNGVAVRNGFASGGEAGGAGAGATTWEGAEAGPLESEPVLLEFQLYVPGIDRDGEDDAECERDAEGGGEQSQSKSQSQPQHHESEDEESAMYGDDYGREFDHDIGRNRAERKYSNNEPPRSIFDRYLELQRLERRVGSSSVSLGFNAVTSGLRLPTDRYDSSSSYHSEAASPTSPYPRTLTTTTAARQPHIAGYAGNVQPPALAAPSPPPASVTLQQLRTQAALRAISSHSHVHVHSHGHAHQQQQQQQQQLQYPLQPQPQPQPQPQSQTQTMYRTSAGVQELAFTPTPASVAADMHMLAARAAGTSTSTGTIPPPSSASVSSHQRLHSPAPACDAAQRAAYAGLHPPRGGGGPHLSQQGTTAYAIAGALGGPHAAHGHGQSHALGHGSSSSSHSHPHSHGSLSGPGSSSSSGGNGNGAPQTAGMARRWPADAAMQGVHG